MDLNEYATVYAPRLRRRIAYDHRIYGADLDDLMQIVTVKVWQALESGWVRDNSRPAAWLTTIARNTAIDWQRQRARRERYFPTAYPQRSTDNEGFNGDLDPMAVVVDPAPGPEDLIVANESKVVACLAREWDALPPTQRAALGAVGLDGMTHTQAAVALGVPLGTLKTRQRLGRLKLAHCLLAVTLAGVA